MMKLLCHLFKCSNSQEAAIERVNSLEASLKEDEKRLSEAKKELLEIKTHLGLPTHEKPSIASQIVTWFTAAIFVSLLCTVAALIGVVSKDDLGDFLSYALPSLAAIVAGLGIFIGNDKKFYYLSCLFVVAGLVTYAKTKYDVAKIHYLEIIIFYGLSILAGIALILYGKKNKEKTRLRYIVKQRIFFFLLVIAIADFAYIFLIRKDLITITPKQNSYSCEVR